MKKKLSVILAFAGALVCAAALASCAPGGDETIHKHTWANEFSKDGSSHWYACADCGKKKDIAPHNFTNGDCICGLKQTEALKYSLNADRESYTVTGATTEVVNELILPSEYNGLPVTAIGTLAFNGYTNLTSVTIPDSVTSIGVLAFQDCTSLATITIPDSVTTIKNNAFLNTAYYKDENNWEDRVLYIGKHFIRAERTLSGNYTVKDGTKTIADEAFFGCNKLTDVTIPGSVTDIGKEMFVGCDVLKTITVENGNTKYHSAGNCLIETQSKMLVATCAGSIIPADGSVERIGSKAFYCSSITSITIPDSVITIKESAFLSCTSLTSVTVGRGVKYIGKYAFNGCVHLVEIYNKSSLSITAGSSRHGEIAYNARNVYTQEGGSKLSVIDDVFIIYDGNTLVNYIGNSLNVIVPNSITIIGKHAFYGYQNFEKSISITISDSVTSIEADAFLGTAFDNATIPAALVSSFPTGYLSSVTVTGSGSVSGFQGCTRLRSVVIENGVTEIGSSAFRNCASLLEITIPDSVTDIGSNAFEYCSNLSKINFRGTKAQWNAFEKDFHWDYATGNYTVYCTDGNLSKR